MVALIQARRGQRTAALAATEEAVRLPTHMYDADLFAPSWLAQVEVLTALGQVDEAIAELRARHEVGWALGHTLRLDPRWEPLRGAAKFQQLMKEAEARADAQPRPKKI